MIITKSILFNYKSLLFTVIFLQISLEFSCNKSSTLGSDLLSNEWINAQGVDTFSMTSSSYIQDSLIYGSPGFPTTLFVGKLEDPIFGSYYSEMYSQLYFGLTKEVGFLNSTIDSIVLSIRYDTSAFFGDPDGLQSVHVYPLIDSLDYSKIYYKDVKLNYSSMEFGSLINFKPNLTDSIKFKIKDVEYGYAPQLRIKLDTFKFMNLMRSFPDTVFNNLSSFNRNFPGIALVSDANTSLLGLLPNSNESRITIYYSSDTIKAQFVFSLGLSRVSTNQINNQGSKVESFVNHNVSGDSIGFIQGFGGTDLRIKIPYHPEWANQLVNYAVLEIVSPDILGDDPKKFKRPTFLNIKELSNGKPVNILDAAFALSYNNLNSYVNYFGGSPVKTILNGEEVYKYKFNITAYFTQMKKAKADLDLIITPLFKVQSPNRLIVGGNKNSKYPSKLILVLSD
ncbi:MAG: DUF4270 family protein [Saprospiraceae bacterium]